MEELLESEVMWPENLHTDAIWYETVTNPANQLSRASKYGNGSTASTPIAIPGTSTNWLKEEECSNEQVPPHVLVSRKRNTGKLAFPLCSGQGRTLKGRDLRDVRNAVWRMTGFLDG
ncbi:protein S40-3-like [Carex rostrata]